MVIGQEASENGDINDSLYKESSTGFQISTKGDCIGCGKGPFLNKNESRIANMKEIILFPTCLMSVSCPYCETMGNMKFNRPPTKDILARCPKCKERFKIKLNIRKHYRKEISIFVSYSFKDISQIGEADSFTGDIIDLSRGGMSVESASLWLPRFRNKEGKTLTFVFALPPPNKTVKVKGVIKRIYEAEEKGKFKMGVSFTGLDDVTSRKISFFLWN